MIYTLYLRYKVKRTFLLRDKYMFNTYSNLHILCQETAHKILNFKAPWFWSFKNTRYFSKHTDIKVDYV